MRRKPNFQEPIYGWCWNWGQIKILEIRSSELIVVRFTRDAWQFHSRPKIVEQYLGGREIPMSEMDSEIWDLTLKEAICCLNEKKRYRGRNQQTVTLANQPKKGERRRTMWVCPHLNIWTPIDMNIDLTGSLETGIARLKPVHEWLSRVSQWVLLAHKTTAPPNATFQCLLLLKFHITEWQRMAGYPRCQSPRHSGFLSQLNGRLLAENTRFVMANISNHCTRQKTTRCCHWRRVSEW